VSPAQRRVDLVQAHFPHDYRSIAHIQLHAWSPMRRRTLNANALHSQAAA